ncbi:hypothetical protein FRX31_007781, partial [Thalictrum thalictroides]
MPKQNMWVQREKKEAERDNVEKEVLEKNIQPDAIESEVDIVESEGEKTSEEQALLPPVETQTLGSSGSSEIPRLDIGEQTQKEQGKSSNEGEKRKDKEPAEENQYEWETPSRKHSFKPVSPLGKGGETRGQAQQGRGHATMRHNTHDGGGK